MLAGSPPGGGASEPQSHLQNKKELGEEAYRQISDNRINEIIAEHYDPADFYS